MKKVFLVMAGLVLFSTTAFADNDDARKTVASAGTAEALGTGNFRAIDVCAELNNTGIVAVGFAPIAAEATREGVPLDAGDCWHYEPKDRLGNLALLKIDVVVNGDGVTYTVYD